jgi:RimJ/RimL family protein N-acetyltransferase
VPPTPYLETDRLVLRALTESDVDNLVELDGDPAVVRFLTGGKPIPREDTVDGFLPKIFGYYQRFPGLGCWAAEEKAGAAFLGWFALEPGRGESAVDVELGYRLRRPAWGKGYATEGSRALVAKAFAELRVERVYAETMAVNVRSRRVMEKTGLRYVRTFHRDWVDPIEGTEHGEVEYAVTRGEWSLPAQGNPPVP